MIGQIENKVKKRILIGFNIFMFYYIIYTILGIGDLVENNPVDFMQKIKIDIFTILFTIYLIGINVWLYRNPQSPIKGGFMIPEFSVSVASFIIGFICIISSEDLDKLIFGLQGIMIGLFLFALFIVHSDNYVIKKDGEL